ncbi:hypothetical protein [Acinetobacter proteolyticus]|uniref:Uncharacterized protein n=1 Tax=Acinetobacter proteolyticus TaxID=1776741 RepID=A0A2N0WDV8_9GAMM|nr:hypothetical protein [Acinetobacter proteolyticus]PKF32873.1 hypothetical protein CW311_12590 [Acinetobacter proteolyticus]
MKELKSVNEIENYIHDLEKKVFQLQNTHAFRVGMAIMKFYDRPNSIKILELNKFIKELLAATKKANVKNNLLNESKIVLKQETIVNYAQVNVNNEEVSSQFYFLPILKDRKQVLTFSNELAKENGWTLLTPNNFKELLLYGNFDEIELNLSHIIDNPLWSYFGTYDDIPKTNQLLDLLLRNNRINKVLIHQNDLALFPIILDRLSLFNNVLFEKSI